MSLSEPLRFALVGGCATIIHVLVAVATERWTPAGQYASNVAGYASALALSYVGHAALTFKTPILRVRQIGRFTTVSASGLCLGFIVIRLASALPDLPFPVTMATTGLLVASWTYALSKLWTFTPEPTASSSTGATVRRASSCPIDGDRSGTT